ncbi:sensor histidine kinase [Paenibacillus roseipurpureus]|uniref:Histidine kinase n=1 Tax=Paenibacillus roseopurpureus TaxID=2918901 RepID=A0AA96LRI5_9BACL|nr:histidine kinase [Paenibacillus sp. MBLB1832]WNR45983.1 histidine kinase [Paenibacillus sp. MBLB1832]
MERKLRLNTFGKMLILLIVLLIPILLLFTYTNLVSNRVVKDVLQESNRNRLMFFTQQLNAEVSQLAVLGNLTGRDPSVQSLDFKSTFSPLEVNSLYTTIVQKLQLQSISSKWDNDIRIYYPHSNLLVTAQPNYTSGSEPFTPVPGNKWIYQTPPNGAPRFIRQSYEPYYVDTNPINALHITQVTFPAESLQTVLEQYNKTGNRGEVFLYQDGQLPIFSRKGSSAELGQLLEIVSKSKDKSFTNEVINLNKAQYLINAAPISSLEWIAVQVIPIAEVISPLNASRNLFYFTAALTVALGIIALLLLYRNVQIPIRELIHAVQRLRKGNYGIRVPVRSGMDFEYLFLSFNEMASEIQVLIENVYAEKLRSREATLKQLQAQINPHFLYNCLYYIMNVASLGEVDAVMAMSLNLGEYYRYTTRVEKTSATLKDEIKLVHNYLAIQNLRMKRLHYNVFIEADMEGLEVPRLLVQPLVENAVIHGLEPKVGDGYITLHGRRNGSFWQIAVEDNGVGMSIGAISRLSERLQNELEGDMGCGLWNVHQRLRIQYGDQAGLRIEARHKGGMRFVLQWPA